MKLIKINIITLLFMLGVILPIVANADESSDYQYKVGEKLANSLLKNCSLYVGTITNIQQQKVGFIIQENLWGDKSKENLLQLDYLLPRSNSRISSEAYSPWSNVDLQDGRKLFVSNCKNDVGSLKYEVIVSREELFSAIKEVIVYHTKLQQNSDVLFETPQILSTKDNFVFAGYIIAFLRSSWLNNKDNSALVLSQLLGNHNVPPSGTAYVRITLRHLLLREGEDALTHENRNAVITGIINAGTSNERAEQALILLMELAGSDKLNIKPFLNNNNRQSLLRNYQKFASKNSFPKGYKEFEQILNAN